MNGVGNFAYQTPGQYRVFFMDLSSVVLNALSQYDAKKKAQTAHPDKKVSHAQLISQTQVAYKMPISIQSVGAKAQVPAEKKIRYT